jgi:hypothetical protein
MIPDTKSTILKILSAVLPPNPPKGGAILRFQTASENFRFKQRYCSIQKILRVWHNISHVLNFAKRVGKTGKGANLCRRTQQPKAQVGFSGLFFFGSFLLEEQKK